MKLGNDNIAAAAPNSRRLPAPRIWITTWITTCVMICIFTCIMALCACNGRRGRPQPYIEFTRLPAADEGGPEKLDLIEGRVIGAKPGQQMALFAKSGGSWYVQPLVEQTLTEIQADGTWKSTTHLGTHYAALLVDPGYRPPLLTAELPGPGAGVVAVAIRPGVPVFWRRWWFLTLCGLAFMSLVSAAYSYRLLTRSRQMNIRFEERLAERAQVAQELHDTLLQSVISASMQLHVAVDGVPKDLPAKPSLDHVQRIMGQVIDEGRTALQRLRSSPSNDSSDIVQAFERIQTELAGPTRFTVRVVVEGRRRPLHPIIRDEVYRIGREAIVDAVKRWGAEHVEVHVAFRAGRFRVVIRHDSRERHRDRHDESTPVTEARDFGRMRTRAQSIGVRLKLRRRGATGTEVELSVPGRIAFQDRSARSWLGRLSRWYPQKSES